MFPLEGTGGGCASVYTAVALMATTRLAYIFRNRSQITMSSCVTAETGDPINGLLA